MNQNIKFPTFQNILLYPNFNHKKDEDITKCNKTTTNSLTWPTGLFVKYNFKNVNCNLIFMHFFL